MLVVGTTTRLTDYPLNYADAQTDSSTDTHTDATTVIASAVTAVHRILGNGHR